MYEPTYTQFQLSNSYPNEGGWECRVWTHVYIIQLSRSYPNWRSSALGGFLVNCGDV